MIGALQMEGARAVGFGEHEWIPHDSVSAYIHEQYSCVYTSYRVQSAHRAYMLCTACMDVVLLSKYKDQGCTAYLVHHIYIYVKVEFDFSLALLIGCGCSLLVGSSATLPHHFSTFHTALSFLPPTCGCLAALPRCLAALSFLPLLSYCLFIDYLLDLSLNLGYIWTCFGLSFSNYSL